MLDLITRVLISNRVESNNAGYSHVVYFVFSLRTVKVHTKSCGAKNGFADSILVVVASQQDYYKACVTDTTVQQRMCGTWLNIATTVFIIRPDGGKIFIEGANYFRAVLDDASWKTHGFCPDNCIFQH